MLLPEHLKVVKALTQQLNPRQLAWLSGYLAGINQPQTAISAITTNNDGVSATLLYGSEGGNGKQIATALADKLNQQQLPINVVSMADYKTARLKKETVLFIIVSTHGEGDPPDTAKPFYDFLQSKRAPKLPSLRYSLLALGDSSYDNFCQTGRDIDQRLKDLGAVTIVDRIECDIDFERLAQKWQQQVSEHYAQLRTPIDRAPDIITLPQSLTNETPTSYNRQNPFTATVLENIVLTTPPRRTFHIELSLEESGLTYTPGDCLGIWPQNNPAIIEKIVTQLKLNCEQSITLDDETKSVNQWLLSHLDITRPTTTVLTRYNDIAKNTALSQLLTNRQTLNRYLMGRNFSDVLTDFPPPPEKSEQVLACPRRLAPRLYSIASCAQANLDEAHLLIALETFNDANDKSQFGLCSQYLSNTKAGDPIQVFIQENENFRLPNDPNSPIIMIGAGTGVAPFRAFIEQREETKSGDSWLFFGERHRRHDFYYQTEWLAHLRKKTLSRLEVAFSRDQNHKIYVQDKIRQHQREISSWIDKGAYIYVCGDEANMAKGVETALIDLLGAGGDIRGDSGLKQLRAQGRYQRDVY